MKQKNECVSLTGSGPIWPRGCPWCEASSRLCSRCRTSFPVASRCSNIPDEKQQDRTRSTAGCPLHRTNTQVNFSSSRRSSTIRLLDTLQEMSNVTDNKEKRLRDEAVYWSWLDCYHLKWCCADFPNIQWRLADICLKLKVKLSQSPLQQCFSILLCTTCPY